MNCYLPWNLKDMTGIPSEKLQKNIRQQTSYMDLYRTELIRESQKSNTAGLLRHVSLNRGSFGTDALSRKATDCLLVFLHALVLLKGSYFTPTDDETPSVGKSSKNLHRLMLENVKATMRFIDYNVLLQLSQGEITEDQIQERRALVHDSVFPEETMMDVCHDDRINDAFFILMDLETKKATGFLDFDVQRNTDLSTDICSRLSQTPRSIDGFQSSQYGIIGETRPYLSTPFIRFRGSYYSFVTTYALKDIESAIADLIPEPEDPSQDALDAPDAQDAPDAPDAPDVQDAPDDTEPEQGVLFQAPSDPYDVDDDDDDEMGQNHESLEAGSDSAYTEVDEYAFPDEFEEDNSNSQETASEEREEVYEVTEDQSDEYIEAASLPDDPYYDEEPYTALVSPDTYAYLDDVKESEFPKEQEIDYGDDPYESDDDEDDDENDEPETEEEPDPYNGESLFSLADEEDDEEDEEEVSHEIVDEPGMFQPTEESIFSEGSDDDDDEPAPTDQEGSDFPLLDRILKFSPSRSNSITQYLTNCSPEQKAEIVNTIEQARSKWLVDGMGKLFSIPDTNISIAVFSASHDPMGAIQRAQNIGAVMYASRKDSWNSLELSYDKSGQLAQAEFKKITKSSFSDWEWKVVEKIGARLMEKKEK